MKNKEVINNQVPLSLKEFVDENHKLLSTIGVFTAITLFSMNLKSIYFSLGLSFLFLFLTLILWSELLSQIPKIASRRMGLFENFLGYSFFGLIIYWIVEYYIVWKLFLSIIIPLVIIFIVSVILKKFDLFNVLFKTNTGEKNTIRHILYWTIIIIAYYLGTKISTIIAPYLEEFLETS